MTISLTGIPVRSGVSFPGGRMLVLPERPRRHRLSQEKADRLIAKYIPTTESCARAYFATLGASSGETTTAGLTLGDVQSEAYMALIYAIRAWDPTTPGSLLGWIRRRITWRLNDLLRKERLHASRERTGQRVLDEDGEEEDLIEQAPAEQEHFDYADRTWAADALAALPEETQRIIRLRTEGLTEAEVADAMGWTSAKVHNDYYRGIARMRKTMGLVDSGRGWIEQ